MAESKETYDYDCVVIGGGSGGLAAGKRAAEHLPPGRVAVLDFVKPSPKGTTWGLGGTCVNVGCIPKKLCHTAGLLGELVHDQQAFGWSAAQPKHDWGKMIGAIGEHIYHMNDAYEDQLRSKKVYYYNALGSFVDAHTIKVTYGNGQSETITTAKTIVAVGGRPWGLGCPGEEHAMSSDDIFWTKTSPGKTLVVGASYVALECAGFLTAMGYDVTVMVRSIILRGFDQDCGNRIVDYMKATGTKFIRSATVSNIDKLQNGKLKVSWKAKSQREPWTCPAGADGEDVFDTVLSAIGRYPDTKGLAIDKVGLTTNKKGEFICTEGETTNVPGIYAFGDCVEGLPELTPVAIQAGNMLADRLFGGKKKHMDYSKVATTVFTPIEYGTVGVSEDEVLEDKAVFGDKQFIDNVNNTYQYKTLKQGVAVYRKEFKPLEWTLTHARDNTECYMKIIVDETDDGRLLGVHYLGPNAGEVMQGFALAMRLGATFEDLKDTVGIHPTNVERFCIMKPGDKGELKPVAVDAEGNVPTMDMSALFGKPEAVCDT